MNINEILDKILNQLYILTSLLGFSLSVLCLILVIFAVTYSRYKTSKFIEQKEYESSRTNQD